MHRSSDTIHKSGAWAHAKFVAARPQTPLNFSAISMSRRSASDRDGRSGWRFAQASTSAVSAGGARKVSMGSLPVAGRPRFLGITFFVLDFLATLGVT